MLKPLFLLSTLLLAGVPAATPLSNPAQTPSDDAKPAAAAPVPPEFLRMINPVKATPDSRAYARKMYGFDCAMCHGANGNGKGEMAADMKLTLKDLTDPASLKDLTDGEIFYVIKNGRGNMLGEGDRLKPDQLWNMVLLVRSFSTK